MVKLCLICSAEQSVVHPNRSFHKIPKDAYKRQKWLDSIGRKSSYNGAVICSDHFSPEDFFPREGYTVLPRLRSSAVPKLSKKNNSTRNVNKQDECEGNKANNKELLVQNEVQTYNTVINDQEVNVTENRSNHCNVSYEDISIDIVKEKIISPEVSCVENRPRNQNNSIYLDCNVSYGGTLIDFPIGIVDAKIISSEVSCIENKLKNQNKSSHFDYVSYDDMPIDIVEGKIIAPELDCREIRPRKRKKELLEMFLRECQHFKIRQIQMHQYATIKEVTSLLSTTQTTQIR